MHKVAFIGTGYHGCPPSRGHLTGRWLLAYGLQPHPAKGPQPLVDRGARCSHLRPLRRLLKPTWSSAMVGYPEDVEELYLAGDGLLTSHQARLRAHRPHHQLAFACARHSPKPASGRRPLCLRLPGDGWRGGRHRRVRSPPSWARPSATSSPCGRCSRPSATASAASVALARASPLSLPTR